jgi:hypothetical protein
MSPTMESSPPDVILYSRDGCHLCDETRTLLQGLIAARRDQGLPAPRLVERDITSDLEWERSYRDVIPVVEVAGRRLQLVTSASRIERLFREVLDARTTAP